MRIAQITPGVIPIPPNGWGAVEKIIWEYTKVLRSLGHQVEILYTDEVVKGEWDIVHVHMANLALILRDKGIPYVFSHHDHHAYWLGKDSDVYKQNLEAIKGSVLSFVHAKYLVDYFGSLPNIRYLGHGVNIHDYEFKDRSEEVLYGETRLLLMANNGILGNPTFDRKGFIPGIEAAKRLNLPITVICPRKNNEDFFNSNPGLREYSKLRIKYDLDYESSLDEMKRHHIFLNPSILEAGHPNLTVTESISCGIPVCGTGEERIPGTEIVGFDDNKVNPDDLAGSIKKIIDSYPSYVMECEEQRNLFSWEVVVSRMLMDYASFGNIGQKDLILDSYRSAEIRRAQTKEGDGFYYYFSDHPYFYKSSRPQSNWSTVVFKDKRTGRVISYSSPGSGDKVWQRLSDSSTEYIDWQIVIKEGHSVLETIEMDLKGKHVLINKGHLKIQASEVERFVSETGCVPTFSNELEGLRGFKTTENIGLPFYRILNTDQILDYFREKIPVEERVLINLKSKALGDTISFLPYANEYAKRRGIKCDVICNLKRIYEGIYPNIEITEEQRNDVVYSDVITCDYDFNVPLQEGFAKQLGVWDAGRIRPRVKPSEKGRPMDKRYVCFSMHSTTQAKLWNNKEGWKKLCSDLKDSGLIPVCIDRYQSFGIEGNWNPIPENCKDKTGMDIEEMMHWIEHCEFFIGLSSGLTWVAHALGKKCVVISGVTSPENEFTEDIIRVHRDDVCNSCFNKPNEFKFNAGDWLWCPVHKGTGRQFECTKRISAKQIMDRIRKEGWI